MYASWGFFCLVGLSALLLKKTNTAVANEQAKYEDVCEKIAELVTHISIKFKKNI